MPEHAITLSDADLDMLERVRQSQGLADVHQAAEWLAKVRLRRAARASTGRGRALNLVHVAAPKPEGTR
ncbi:hypothetical protein [Rubrivivax gelatinosus]|uniref:Uncharacterized protein n=1 Tax=Rubrivivax gelatinosus TaxID=28068 RepID=A0ABS1DMP2_RUBGE|nr:hypothetical protein [Rubrivivax gelatinosus]MBK1711282.1 hypothetical protein [Rubrivivax gelatinosus]